MQYRKNRITAAQNTAIKSSSTGLLMYFIAHPFFIFGCRGVGLATNVIPDIAIGPPLVVITVIVLLGYPFTMTVLSY